jgi:hypothetical protein
MSDSHTTNQTFEALQELSQLMPDMRSGQLIAAIGELCADLHGHGLWDASDAEFMEAIRQFRGNYHYALHGGEHGPGGDVGASPSTGGPIL